MPGSIERGLADGRKKGYLGHIKPDLKPRQKPYHCLLFMVGRDLTMNSERMVG